MCWAELFVAHMLLFSSDLRWEQNTNYILQLLMNVDKSALNGFNVTF